MISPMKAALVTWVSWRLFKARILRDLAGSGLKPAEVNEQRARKQKMAFMLTLGLERISRKL
jgi:hypothetical protein